MIRDSSIQEVKNQIDIIDVIGDFVDLKKAGANYKALSPFTTEKTPSFFVSPSKNLYKCFSTGKGGDAISFLEEHEGFTYLETIRYLANKYGIDLKEEENQEFQEDQSERESIYIVLNYANELYKSLLWENEEGQSIGLSYFRERGLSDQTIKEFQLGYSLQSWDHLLSNAKSKGYQPDILEKAGLIIRKEGGKEYDRFRERAMFPIHSLTGRVIGFGARQLTSDKKQPKYINSPDSEVYNKSAELYGLFQARREIRNEDRCFLVEGYMDVLAMAQAGVKNVVASSGTSLTEDQVKLISRYSKNITILYDGDPAGIKAALRGIDLIIEKGLNVKIMLLPGGHDPDSFLKENGVEEFKQILEKESKDFIEFKAWLLEKEGHQDPEHQISAIREIIESISKIPDTIARSVHIRNTSEKFNLDEGVVYAEVNKRILQRRKKEALKEDQAPQERPVERSPSEFVKKDKLRDHDSVISEQEKECLRLLLYFGKEPESDADYFYRYYFENTEDIQYLDPLVNRVISLYQEAIERDILPEIEYFSEIGDDKIKNLMAELYFQKYELSKNWEQKYSITVLKEYQMLDVVFPRNILLLKFRHLGKKLDDDLARLKNAKNKEEEDEIMDEYLHFKQYHMEYAKELGIVVNR